MKMPDFHPWIFWLLLKLVKFAALPAGFGATWLGRRWMLSRSTHWPVTWGTVQGYAPPVEGSHAVAMLLYSYSVNGDYYSGELPVPKRGAIRDKDDARHLLPIGANIEVRYSPMKPHRSVALIPEMIALGVPSSTT
jgi:hypothetical protein